MMWLGGSPLLWVPSRKPNDSFQQALILIRPTERSTWRWKVSGTSQQKTHSLSSEKARLHVSLGFPGGTSGKDSTCKCRLDVRHAGSIPGSGRSPGDNDKPLQFSCLENPMDRGAWRAPVHWVAQNWTWLKRPSTSWCAYLMTRQKLLQLGWGVLIHSQYWLNIAPSGFHLFWSLQNSLNGKNFNSLEDCKRHPE